MDFDVTKIGDAVGVGEGVKELGDTIEEKTARFHENFVSKVVPVDGKYGEAATFVAEMIPGVSAYNAIREGDWQQAAFDITLDIGVLVIGVATAGTGVAAGMGIKTMAKSSLRGASKNIMKQGSEMLAKEGSHIVAKAAVREGTEVIGEKVVKEGTEMLVKESGEAITTQVTKETGQVVGKYSDEILKAAEVKPAQLKIFEVENLEEGVVNGKRVLKQADLDLSNPEQMERIKKGLAPLGKDGKPIELHHIGQKNDSPLAEIDASVHKRNFKDLHKVDGTPSQIDRNAFRKEKKEHWQARAAESRGEI